MVLISITELVGRFHPLLVHLPIGILLIACLFQLLTWWPRWNSLKPAIPLMILLGAVSALGSSVSGWFLSETADYNADLITRHQWLGIMTTVGSLVFWLLCRYQVKEQITRAMSIGLIGLITITGHLGGSLTHGEGFLTEGLGGEPGKGPVLQKVPDIQSKQLYTDLVQPIFEARCYSCHGPNKQKGKLRLDQQSFILKGGEDGVLFETGKPDESALIEKLLLAKDAKKHMPPKAKPQLTKDEIAILHWWVQTGAPFTKKVNELSQTAKIKSILAALESGMVSSKADDELIVPELPVTAADPKVVESLKKMGIVVLPVAQNSNYLSVNFVTAVAPVDEALKQLEGLKKQLLWLKLDGVAVGEKGVRSIGSYSNLTRLQLSNCDLFDKDVALLNTLSQLRSLNLVGTKISSKGLQALASLKQLKNIYCYRTSVERSSYEALRKSFPEAAIDTGNYRLPMLVGDTSVVKAEGKRI